MLSFMIIFAGTVNIIMGNFSGRNLSDSFYDSFPETRRSGQSQKNAGIAVLVIGIILLTLSIAWCRYARRHLSNMPTTFSGTAMTTTVVAPNCRIYTGVSTTSHYPGRRRRRRRSTDIRVFISTSATSGVLSAGPNRYEPVSTGSTCSQPVPTGSTCCQPVPTRSTNPTTISSCGKTTRSTAALI